MDIFLKAVAGMLTTVILCQVLSKNGKDITVLLIITACCLVLITACAYLRPIIDFFRNLQFLGQLNPEIIEILLKAVGISILSEVASLVCADAGNAALGKGLQILAVSVVLWISIPLFNELLDLLETVLGAA